MSKLLNVNHRSLLNALISYDAKQSQKPGWNRYAMSHYCKALQKVETNCRSGSTVRDAILSNFCGIQFVNRLLKAVGEEKLTDIEKQNQ